MEEFSALNGRNSVYCSGNLRNWAGDWINFPQKLSTSANIVEFVSLRTNSFECGLSNGSNILILILHFDPQNGRALNSQIR